MNLRRRGIFVGSPHYTQSIQVTRNIYDNATPTSSIQRAAYCSHLATPRQNDAESESKEGRTPPESLFLFVRGNECPPMTFASKCRIGERGVFGRDLSCWQASDSLGIELRRPFRVDFVVPVLSPTSPSGVMGVDDIKWDVVRSEMYRNLRRSARSSGIDPGRLRSGTFPHY